jgi:hypothetical protein
MLLHLVLLELRPGLSTPERTAFAESFRRAVATIPSVRGCRLGRRVTHGAGYEAEAPEVDILALLEFDDLAGLQAYLRHPAHEELGHRFGDVTGGTERASSGAAWVLDFEAGGLEELERLV